MLMISKILVLLSMFAPEHLILVLVIVLLLFGGKKIPELMRGLGKGIREFNDAKDNVKTQLEEGLKEKDKDQEINELRKQVQQLQQNNQSQEPAK